MKRLTTHLQNAPWLTGFGVFFVLGTLLFGWGMPGNPEPQPISYNHSIHIEAGLACEDCHTGARDQAQATLPAIDTCLMCHEEAISESAEEEKVRDFARAGQEIPWRKVTNVPTHVYFSHRRHVTLGEMACTDCHGPMETLTEPPGRPFLSLTMDACMDCHEQRNVRNDCNDCHR